MSNKMTELERKALEIALAGPSEWLTSLRAQIPKLRVVNRNYTGVGFFVDFECDNCVAATGIPPSGALERVPGAWASHRDVLGGAPGAICFNVFAREGVIVCLEGASASDWPEDEDLIEFAQVTDP